MSLHAHGQVGVTFDVHHIQDGLEGQRTPDIDLSQYKLNSERDVVMIGEEHNERHTVSRIPDEERMKIRQSMAEER